MTDDGVDPTMLLDRVWGLVPAGGIPIAPEGFGPFAGDAFVADEGTTKQMHVTLMSEGPLPTTPRSSASTSRAALTTSQWASRAARAPSSFAGNRLPYGQLRRSYSTGDYHEPGSSINESVYDETG